MDNGNFQKNGAKKATKPDSFECLESGIQTYLMHRAPSPKELSDSEVKAFWSEFKLQNSNPKVDLNVTVAIMRRIMASASRRRENELNKRRKSRLMAGVVR